VLASGLLLGPGFGMLFGGLLMARFGWRPFFIVLGLLSMLWILPWLKVDAEEAVCREGGKHGRTESFRVLAATLRLGNLHRPVLRELC